MKRYEAHIRLSPPKPTLKQDLCRCAGRTPFKLMYALGYNPVHCLNCNKEIPLPQIHLSRSLVFDIAQWREMYGGIYWLWLDSGEYESWALSQSTNVNSPINQRGLTVTRTIGKRKRCYYWLHQDESRETFVPLSKCPSCGRRLQSYAKGRVPQLLCQKCTLVMSGNSDAANQAL